MKIKNQNVQHRSPGRFNFRLVDVFFILVGLIILVFVTMGCYLPAYGEPDEDENIFISVEKMPEFPGGSDSLKAFIHRSIRYPEKYGEVCIQGRVICRFVINEDGSVSQATVLRGIAPDLDAEAIRVINTMPNWEPGIEKSNPVKVKYTIPVNFMH